MKKRILAVILCALMLCTVALTSCKNGTDTSSAPEQSPADSVPEQSAEPASEEQSAPEPSAAEQSQEDSVPEISAEESAEVSVEESVEESAEESVEESEEEPPAPEPTSFIWLKPDGDTAPALYFKIPGDLLGEGEVEIEAVLCVGTNQTILAVDQIYCVSYDSEDLSDTDAVIGRMNFARETEFRAGDWRTIKYPFDPFQGDYGKYAETTCAPKMLVLAFACDARLGELKIARLAVSQEDEEIWSVDFAEGLDPEALASDGAVNVSEETKGTLWGIDEAVFTAYERGTVPFSEMTYVRPDFDEIDALIAEGESLMEKAEITPREMTDFFEKLTIKVVCAIGEDTMVTIISDCNTADKDLQDETEQVSELISNARKSYFQFASKLLDSEKYSARVFKDYSEEEKKEIRNEADSMDDEYVQFEKRLTELQNKYDDSDSIVVTVNDVELTLGEVTDKFGSSVYKTEFNKAVGEIYLEILDIKKNMAKKHGAEDIVNYIYEHDFSRDFKKEDIEKMYAYVKEYIVPLFNKQYANYSSFIYTAGDYNNIFLYEDILKKYFAEISPKMLEAYEYIRDKGLYIYGDEDVKRTGAYTTILYHHDEPIMFHKFDGSYDNIQTFIHEFGHFYEFYTYGGNSTNQLDIDEIHSQANELLFLPVYDEIFGPAATKKITRYQLFMGMYTMIQSSVLSEFETRAFEGEYSSVEELNDLFKEVVKSYNMSRFFSATTWSQVPHLFLYPHYYISYGTSVIPALQIYAISLEDRAKAIEVYNEVIAHSDADTPFFGVLEAAGLKDPFTEDTFKELYDMLVASFPKK